MLPGKSIRQREVAMTLRLIIGNKNYSSWSFRPWIAMKTANIPFDETVVSLNDPDFKKTVHTISPAGKVPAIADDGAHVWESLAILEYLAERFPAAGLWPADRAARAHARAISSEMHAGFVPLRRECPMNFWRPKKSRELSAEARQNIARIDAMWADCRARFGQGGPFLFGRFGAADAMYAPVVTRFRTYGVKLDSDSEAYCNAVMDYAPMKQWIADAKNEPWLIAAYELG